MTWVWSTWNNRNCEHEDTCCGLRGELGAIKFRTLLHILHHLAEIVLYLHIADVGGWRQQTPQICQAAASSQQPALCCYLQTRRSEHFLYLQFLSGIYLSSSERKRTNIRSQII